MSPKVEKSCSPKVIPQSLLPQGFWRTPEIWDQTAYFVLLSTYLIYRLTGEL